MSTNDPKATIIPLTFIIIVGIIKEGVVELKKAFDDGHINGMLYKKFVNPNGRAENVYYAADDD